MKRLLLFLALCGVGLYLLLSGNSFTRFWQRCLVVSVPLERADALIVLGGEAEARPVEAARLYRQGVAPLVFVTGLGDASRNRQILIGAGVPALRITTEPKATSTYENAVLLKPLLERSDVKSAVIVTSPFHTRRALATFRKLMPGITFGVTDAPAERWKSAKGREELNRLAFLEMLKTLAYWIRNDISPFYLTGKGAGE